MGILKQLLIFNIDVTMVTEPSAKARTYTNYLEENQPNS